MSNLLGLDIGTTGCKAILFDSDGTLLAKASREYIVDIPQPQWAEQDLDGVWQMAQQAICEVLSTAQVKDVDAIGLSVHGEAVTPVDGSGRALRPTILGMDTRTTPQNVLLQERFGAEYLFQHTGMPIHTVNTLPKLLWLKEHEPEIWKKASKFLLVEDYLIMKMTGQAVTSLCLASRTQMCELNNGMWSQEILQFLELDGSRLATINLSGTPAGELSAELTANFGLSHRPIVVNGGHDQACGALGVGLTCAGLAEVSTGTAEVVEVALQSPVVSQPLFEGNISVYHHVVPGLFLAMTLNHSGGMSLRWFRDGFCEPQVYLSAQSNTDAYDMMLAGSNPGPTGLYVMPHFAGSGTPTFDTASKAAILGLTFATNRSDIAKAILEGLTYELRLNLDLLKSGGVAIDSLRAIGGGAKSSLWLQLKADITGIPVYRPQITEAAAWGAALLAGYGAGVFKDIAKAADAHIVLEECFEPNQQNMEKFQKGFEIYKQIYPSLAPLLHQMD